MMARPIAAAVPAYLLGSIPFTYIAGRLCRGVDLSARGGGNLGGTNTMRILGLIPGIIALACRDKIRFSGRKVGQGGTKVS